MGVWSSDIMGSDLADFLSDEWSEQFGTTKVPPSSVLDFIEDYTERRPWHDTDIAQIAGYLTMQSQSKMSKKLRRVILEAIDEELLLGCVDWDVPADRKHSLTKFKHIVETYNKKGEPVTLPIATIK